MFFWLCRSTDTAFFRWNVVETFFQSLRPGNEKTHICDKIFRANQSKLKLVVLVIYLGRKLEFSSWLFPSTPDIVLFLKMFFDKTSLDNFCRKNCQSIEKTLEFGDICQFRLTDVQMEETFSATTFIKGPFQSESFWRSWKNIASSLWRSSVWIKRKGLCVFVFLPFQAMGCYFYGSRHTFWKT